MINQFRTDSPGAVCIVVILLLQFIRKEKQLEYQEHYSQLYQNQGPQTAADGHFPETTDIQVGNPAEKPTGKVLRLLWFI